MLAPHFPAIAERFYDAVWANPGAAAVLSGPEQVERLRVTLIDWMSTGLLGPYDERVLREALAHRPPPRRRSASRSSTCSRR